MMEAGLVETNKLAILQAIYGSIAPEGIVAKLFPEGTDGTGTPCIQVTMTSVTGSCVLKVVAQRQA